jgi:hypothetical protein
VQRAFDARKGAEVSGALDGAKAEAQGAGVKGTPTILIYRIGLREPKRLEGDDLSVGEVTKALDEALAQRVPD